VVIVSNDVRIRRFTPRAEAFAMKASSERWGSGRQLPNMIIASPPDWQSPMKRTSQQDNLRGGKPADAHVVLTMTTGILTFSRTLSMVVVGKCSVRGCDFATLH